MRSGGGDDKVRAQNGTRVPLRRRVAAVVSARLERGRGEGVVSLLLVQQIAGAGSRPLRTIATFSTAGAPERRDELVIIHERDLPHPRRGIERLAAAPLWA